MNYSFPLATHTHTHTVRRTWSCSDEQFEAAINGLVSVVEHDKETPPSGESYTGQLFG